MLAQKSTVRTLGFTLVELLVVVGIVGILLAMLLPAVQMIREGTRRSACLNNQRQLILAIHSYEAAFGSLPPTLTTRPRDYFLLFWQARSLPFLEQVPLFDAVQSQIRNGVHVYMNPFRRTTIPVLQCLSNPDTDNLIRPDMGALFAFTDYCGVAGSNTGNGIFRLDIGEVNEVGIKLSQVTSGLSNTLIFGERGPSDLDEGFGAWIGGQSSLSASTYTNGSRENFPAKLLVECGDKIDLGYQRGERGSRCDWTHHWSFHPDGANFARADGSVNFLPYQTDKSVLSELASRF